MPVELLTSCLPGNTEPCVNQRPGPVHQTPRRSGCGLVGSVPAEQMFRTGEDSQERNPCLALAATPHNSRGHALSCCGGGDRQDHRRECDGTGTTQGGRTSEQRSQSVRAVRGRSPRSRGVRAVGLVGGAQLDISVTETFGARRSTVRKEATGKGGDSGAGYEARANNRRSME
jgi:hypothetical protein